MAICTNCGQKSDNASALCRHCGAEFMSSGRARRKTVTVLFCDLVHSTGLAERDPETFRRVQTRYFDEMRRVIERHGGTVEKFIGDEVMAVFGAPAVHEDDALRAVRAGLEMLERLSALSDEFDKLLGLRLQARIGVNTGEVLAGDLADRHSFVSGEPVIVAKRLEQAAEPGEMLIGKATYPLVEHAITAGPLERIPIKGKREDVGRRRVDEVDSDAPAVARRLHAAMVGRQDELELLRQSFERTVEESSCRLFTVLGPAGIGKSRLATELLSSVGGRARTAVGRCLPYGEGITFWPITDVLQGVGDESLMQALSSDDERDAVLELLAGATGVSETAGSNEEIFWAVRRAFEALARERPLVVCLEDVHWAEPTLLDLLEYVVGWSRDAPILLVALARPELVEQRPTWIAPQPATDSLFLEPLSSDHTALLLAALGRDLHLPAETREQIGSAAEGNPLFAEQMAAMAAEQDPDGPLRIPGTIHGLLAERLDRLTSEERTVLELASVVGRDFPLGAVSGLASDDQRASLSRNLLALVRKGLIRPDPAPAAEEDRFSFHHVLVRDSAYGAMPKESRAALHEAFANWLPESGSARGLEELVGYHLEQAHRLRMDLGQHDTHTYELARRASDALSSGGSRALGRDDVGAALKLLGRALALRPEDDPAVALRLDLSQALFLSGDVAAASEMANEAAAGAADADDDAGEMRALLAVARIAAQMPRQGTARVEPSAELLTLAAQARRIFAGAGDDVGLTDAWVSIAWAELIRCRFGSMLEAIERALEHARRARYVRWERELPVWKGTALFYGPTPVEEALQWYEQEQPQHSMALNERAVLEAMRHRFSEGRALLEAADAAAVERGETLWRVGGGMAAWEFETLAGNASAAERAARRTCELLEDLGETGFRASAAGQLASSLYALGRLDEAQRWTKEAEELASVDDVMANMLWRQVRAKVLAHAGRPKDAAGFANEAVSLGKQTDMLNGQAAALNDLADVCVFGGRKTQARTLLEEALTLYKRKGNLVSAASARSAIADLG